MQDMYNGVKKLLEIERAAIAYVLLVFFCPCPIVPSSYFASERLRVARGWSMQLPEMASSLRKSLAGF